MTRRRTGHLYRGLSGIAALGLLLGTLVSSMRATPAYGAGTVDWPSMRSDNQLTGNNPSESILSATNVGQLKIAWSSTIRFNPRATPVLAGGLIYLGCWGAGNLPNECAVDAATGLLRWTTAVGTGELPSTAAVDASSGQVYVGGQNPATMYALDPATGSVIWQTGTPAAHFSGAPTLAGGLVYATADDGTLYAFSGNGGSVAWTFAAGTGGATAAPSITTFVSTGVVTVAGSSGSSAALQSRWAGDGRANCGPNLFGSPVVGSPASDGNNIYVGTRNAGGQGVTNFYRVPVGVCNPPSTQPAGGPYVADQIQAIPSSSAAIAGSTVYEGFDDGDLYAFDTSLNQLKPLWKGDSARSAPYGQWSIQGSPAVADGVVYAGSADGHIYAWNAAGCGGASVCQPIWSARLGDQVYAGPVVANGMVFANYGNGADGTLYAFSLNGLGPIPQPPPPTPTAMTDQAVSSQINVGHDGSQPGDALAPTLKRLWEVDFSPDSYGDRGQVSFPLIVNGRVYVSAFSAGVGTALYAFDLNTGNQLWRDMLGPPGGAYRETPTFDNGRIFVSGNRGFCRRSMPQAASSSGVSRFPTNPSRHRSPSTAGYSSAGPIRSRPMTRTTARCSGSNRTRRARSVCHRPVCTRPTSTRARSTSARSAATSSGRTTASTARWAPAPRTCFTTAGCTRPTTRRSIQIPFTTPSRALSRAPTLAMACRASMGRAAFTWSMARSKRATRPRKRCSGASRAMPGSS